MAAVNLAVDPVMQLATIGVLGVLAPKAALGDLMTSSYPSRSRLSCFRVA